MWAALALKELGVTVIKVVSMEGAGKGLARPGCRGPWMEGWNFNPWFIFMSLGHSWCLLFGQIDEYFTKPMWEMIETKIFSLECSQPLNVVLWGVFFIFPDENTRQNQGNRKKRLQFHMRKNPLTWLGQELSNADSSEVTVLPCRVLKVWPWPTPGLGWGTVWAYWTGESLCSDLGSNFLLLVYQQPPCLHVQG